LFTVLIVLPRNSFAASAADDIERANDIISQTIQSVDKGDMGTATEQFKTFTSTWLSIEDGVKEQSQEAYHDIEDNMGQVSFAFAQQPINQEKIKNALLGLKNTNQKFIDDKFTSTSEKRSSAKSGDVAELVSLLNQSLSKIKHNDIQGAMGDIEKFRQSWLNVEGVVLTQSSKIYSNAERDMVASYSMLSSNDVSGAKKNN
jgi:high-affinity iron transporter